MVDVQRMGSPALCNDMTCKRSASPLTADFRHYAGNQQALADQSVKAPAFGKALMEVEQAMSIEDGNNIARAPVQ